MMMDNLWSESVKSACQALYHIEQVCSEKSSLASLSWGWFADRLFLIAE